MLKVNLDENRQRTRSLDLRHKLLVFLCHLEPSKWLLELDSVTCCEKASWP